MNDDEWRGHLRNCIDARILDARILEAMRGPPEESQFDRLLAALQALGITQPTKTRLTFTITLPCGSEITGASPMALVLKDNQSVTYTIGGKDSAGNPATIAGPVTWALSDSTVLSVTPAADGMSAVVAALGPLSTAAGVQLTVSDTGDGGLTGSDNITVVSSSATSLTLTAGAPTP
jgi:hypothetical protein